MKYASSNVDGVGALECVGGLGKEVIRFSEFSELALYELSRADDSFGESKAGEVTTISFGGNSCCC